MQMATDTAFNLALSEVQMQKSRCASESFVGRLRTQRSWLQMVFHGIRTDMSTLHSFGCMQISATKCPLVLKLFGASVVDVYLGKIAFSIAPTMTQIASDTFLLFIFILLTTVLTGG